MDLRGYMTVQLDYAAAVLSQWARLPEEPPSITTTDVLDYHRHPGTIMQPQSFPSLDTLLGSDSVLHSSSVHPYLPELPHQVARTGC